MDHVKTPEIRRIGIVSTRIEGTDGVSLEVGKWADCLEQMGYECYYVCGKSDRPAERTFLVEHADFRDPLILEITEHAFGTTYRSRELTNRIEDLKTRLKQQLYEAIETLDLDLLIAQNALTIPLNIPLGMALVEVLIESRIPSIAHHHDFVWERKRFMVNAVDDYLLGAFPPALRQIDHVVINTVAGEEFSRRTGLPYRVIPNVMDFDHPPEPPDEYARQFRKDFGIAEDDFLIVQPTRIVPRKGIEHSIELVRRLNDPRAKLLITGHANDEGTGYLTRILDYAALLGVEPILAHPWIGSRRGTATDGRRRYTIWDVYPQADLIAYPSTYEGFGNAFLEAVYYRRPIFCNRYTIFQTDIEPYGFEAVVMNDFLTDDVVEKVRAILEGRVDRREMVERNYDIGRTHFGYKRVKQELAVILRGLQACICPVH